MSKVFDQVESDGVFVSKRVYQPHEDRIYRQLSQPSRKLILERNAELRKNDVIKDLSFGRFIADIPLIDMENLRKKYPDLASHDSKIRSKALFNLLNSPEGRIYLVGSGT